ncbi:MAG: Hint domain-containing protein [Tranquillimonas sp.]|jgi:hypothetical protein
MSYPHPSASLPALRPLPSGGRPWTVRHGGTTARPRPTGPQRRYEISWLDPQGDAQSAIRAAPAIPMFEDAFAAIARGALIPTSQGPVAVEDLYPGIEIETSAGLEPLLWMGAITLLPAGTGPESLTAPRAARLYRIPADAFGLGRPMPDLVLGPAARLVDRSPALRAALGTQAALAPVAPLADGLSIVEVTPVAPVRVFHLGFREHRLFCANGVEIESVHPGGMDLAMAGTELMGQFMAMFPHIRTTGDFGRLALPRLSTEEMQNVLAA